MIWYVDSIPLSPFHSHFYFFYRKSGVLFSRVDFYMYLKKKTKNRQQKLHRNIKYFGGRKQTVKAQQIRNVVNIKWWNGKPFHVRTIVWKWMNNKKKNSSEKTSVVYIHYTHISNSNEIAAVAVVWFLLLVCFIRTRYIQIKGFVWVCVFSKDMCNLNMCFFAYV